MCTGYDSRILGSDVVGDNAVDSGDAVGTAVGRHSKIQLRTGFISADGSEEVRGLTNMAQQSNCIRLGSHHCTKHQQLQRTGKKSKLMTMGKTVRRLLATNVKLLPLPATVKPSTEGAEEDSVSKATYLSDKSVTPYYFRFQCS